MHLYLLLNLYNSGILGRLDYEGSIGLRLLSLLLCGQKLVFTKLTKSGIKAAHPILIF